MQTMTIHVNIDPAARTSVENNASVLLILAWRVLREYA
jgi:hypothetical protein